MMMMDEVPLTGIFFAWGSISAELTVIHNANMCCQDNFRKKRQSGKHLGHKLLDFNGGPKTQINYAKLFRDEKQIKAKLSKVCHAATKKGSQLKMAKNGGKKPKKSRN